MKPRLSTPFVLVLALAAGAAAARAEDAQKSASGKDPARNEVYVFGGISILDAHSSRQATISLPRFPGFPGFPGMPAWPTDGADIQVNAETKLGNSALLGLRYSFYLRKQLALEADFAVAPSADLQSSVGVCGASRCYGRGDYEGAGGTRPYDAAMNGFFAGPMGQRFRGMGGMRAGEGPHEGGYGFGGRSVTAWHYGGNVAYDILGGDVRPFVLLGAGGVSYDGTAGANTDFTLRFGGGLKVYFGRIGARVDAIDYLVFDNFLSGRDEHDVHLTGGAFVRF